jgi:subtilisin family serine protease
MPFYNEIPQETNNDFLSYLDQLDNKDPIECKEIIADLSTSLLLGKGVTITSADETNKAKIEEFNKANHTFDKIYHGSWTVSKNGGIYVVPNKTKKGKVF